MATEKNYDDFIQNHPEGNLFQSGFFGDFQKTIPYRGKAWRLISKDGCTSCLVVRQKLPFGFSWLWIPYGPLSIVRAKNMELAGFSEVFEQIKSIAKHERAIFARIEPLQTLSHEQAEVLSKKFRVRKSVRRYTPEHSLVVDLDRDEDAILLQMKPKGRYNIKVAQKNGVVVLRYDDFADIPEEDFDAFYEIMKKTGERDDFGVHPKEFYENLIRVFGANKSVSLFLAYNSEKKVIAGVIIAYFKDTATYYYGASDYEHRPIMAPYLLQWEAITEARRRGYRVYDFLGISPAGAIGHAWAGVTDFKRKFGGKDVRYPPAFLLVFKPILHWLISRILKPY